MFTTSPHTEGLAPSVYRIIEQRNDKIFRIVWICPFCSTAYYDFLGLRGIKIPVGQNRHVYCDKCIQNWQEKKQSFSHSAYFIGYPKRLTLKDERVNSDKNT